MHCIIIIIIFIIVVVVIVSAANSGRKRSIMVAVTILLLSSSSSRYSLSRSVGRLVYGVLCTCTPYDHRMYDACIYFQRSIAFRTTTAVAKSRSPTGDDINILSIRAAFLVFTATNNCKNGSVAWLEWLASVPIYTASDAARMRPVIEIVRF